MRRVCLIAFAAACTPRPAPIAIAPAPAPPSTTPAQLAPTALPAPIAPTAAPPVVALSADVPPPAITGGVLTHVDRRGDYQLRHGGLMSLAISPDGGSGISGSADGTIAVWDLATGRLVRMIDTPHRNVWAVAIASGGAVAASSGWDGTTRVWDVATGRERWASPPDHDADRLAFSPDGTTLIGHRLEDHRIWKVADGTLIADNRVQRYYGGGGPCDPDPGVPTADGRSIVRVVATGCHEEIWGDVGEMVPMGYAVVVIDPARPAVRAADPALLTVRMAKQHLGSFGTGSGGVALAPAGDKVALIDADHVAVVDVATGKPVATMPQGLGSPATGGRVTLADDGRHLLLLGYDEVRAYDVAAGTMPWSDRFTNDPGGGTPTRTAIPAADVWIIADRQRCIARDMTTGAERWRRDHCLSAAVAGDRVLLTRGPAALDVVDARTGRSTLPPPPATGPTAGIANLDVALDGRVAAGTGENTGWLWDTTGGRELPIAGGWRPRVHFDVAGALTAVAETKGDGMAVYPFATDGASLPIRPIAHRDRLGGGGVFAGDRFVGDEVREDDYLRDVVDLTGKTAPSHLPAWHPTPGMVLRNEALFFAVARRDLARIYLPGNQGELHAWDTRSGRLVARAASPSTQFADAFVLSADERYLVTGFADGTIAVHDAGTLALVRTFTDLHHYAVAAISPDDRYVVGGAFEGLRVWRLADGAVAATVTFERESATALAFSADGGTLWVGTSIGTLHRFTVE